MGTIMALCNIVLSSIVWRSIGREKLYIVRIKSFGMTVVTYILMGKIVKSSTNEDSPYLSYKGCYDERNECKLYVSVILIRTYDKGMVHNNGRLVRNW